LAENVLGVNGKYALIRLLVESLKRTCKLAGWKGMCGLSRSTAVQTFEKLFKVNTPYSML